MVSIVSHDTSTYAGYVDVEPSVKVEVLVTRLEYVMVVVHDGKDMVVALPSGIGGQTSVAPGGPLTSCVAELQIPGSI